MDLIADRGRRVTVEELNTSRLLAHARKQAVQRKFDDMLIVDVDAHHYENENFREFLPYMENDVLRQLAMSGARQGQPRRHHGADTSAIRTWAAALPAIRCARPRRHGRKGPSPRRRARLSLDGRDERRLLLPVPDRHAHHRHASAEGNGGRAVLGLQPLAHREGAAGIGRPLLFDAVRCRSTTPTSALRQVETFGDRKHVGGFMVTTVRNTGGARQPVHEGLSGDRGARPGAVVPLRPELGASRSSRPATASCRCMRSASAGTTSCIAPTGSSTAWASASPSCRWSGSSPASPGCRS